MNYAEPSLMPPRDRKHEAYEAAMDDAENEAPHELAKLMDSVKSFEDAFIRGNDISSRDENYLLELQSLLAITVYRERNILAALPLETSGVVSDLLAHLLSITTKQLAGDA